MNKFSWQSKLCCIFFFIPLMISYAAGDQLTDKVDQVFEKWDSTISPGAALAIIKDGKIIYKRGYGMANLEHNVPITTTTVFPICSTSKQFTAACIAILALQEKISLDDDIRKYIPELPRYEKPITIRHLIHHTSGIRDHIALSDIAGLTDEHYYTPKDSLVLLTRQKKLNFLPGEAHLYCNSGYFLLGIIVKRVSGKSLNDFAREHIFEPLGMKNTLFRDDHTLIVKNRACGYSPAKNGFRIANSPLDHVGASNLFTTVEDLFLWDQAFYRHPLGKELMDLIQTPGKLNNNKKLKYAFGLFIDEYKGLKIVRHAGGNVGFRAQMVRFPGQRFSVICLANFTAINPSVLCKQIATIYLADEFKKAGASVTKKIEPVTLSEKELKEKAGNYQDELNKMWMVFSVKNGKLEMNMWGGFYKLVFSPVSKTRFNAQVPFRDIFIDFAPVKRGGVQKAFMDFDGVIEADLVKVPDPEPLTPSQMQEYVGEYYNDEIPVTYRVAVEKDSLVVKLKNDPEEVLTPMTRDQFAYKWMNIKFIRGKENQITGLTVWSGRSNDVEFIKTDGTRRLF